MTTPQIDAKDAKVRLAAHDVAAKRRLAVYLQDHDAGAQAGVALIGRSCDANRGTEFESDLAELAQEIAEDRGSLRSMMEQLDIGRSRVKEILGGAAELVGRLKTNGHLVRYSASSRVVEFEALAAAVATKRNLWRSLAAATTNSHAELDRLIERSTAQFDRLLALHEKAATLAFTGGD